MVESGAGKGRGEAADLRDGLARMESWIDGFPDQLRGAIARGREIGWPGAAAAPAARGLFLGGMGGSAMAGRLAALILQPDLRIPIVVQADPELPRWVDGSVSLGIASYSGETWEALALADAAAERGISPWVVASGGRLEAYPAASASFHAEPGMQPRAALGWMLVPILLCWAASAGRAVAMEQELRAAADLLAGEADLWRAGRALPGRNPRELADRLAGQVPVLYAESEAERVLAIRWRCQFSENAKRFALENAFPELVHNEIEGWADLGRVCRAAVVRLEGTGIREPRLAPVLSAAESEWRRVGFEVVFVPSHGEGRMARILSQVLLGDRVSLELARRGGVDPVPVEAIQRLRRAVAGAGMRKQEER
ncbi:MAG: hypothetical protein IT349_01135 [Candidatus Eisenbacteria bacterium]|nr:hypothetical protein [Candidatus Eisenbacteria bacterium]